MVFHNFEEDQSNPFKKIAWLLAITMSFLKESPLLIMHLIRKLFLSTGSIAITVL